MDKSPVAPNQPQPEVPLGHRVPLMEKVVDTIQSHEDEEVCGASRKMTREEMLEKIGTLNVNVEEKRKLVDDLKAENEKLSESVQTIKDTYKVDWSDRMQHWKAMKAKRPQLLEEQRRLEEIIEPLKQTLGVRMASARVKLEEIRKLTWRMNELEAGKGSKTSVVLREVEPPTGIFVGGRKDAETLLPEEIWELIFEKLSHPKDLWNLCNTCQLFGQVLSQWKAGWLLEQALPDLYQHLPGNKLLECRRMCKSWKSTMDQFLDDHPSMRPHNSEKHDPRRVDFVNPMKEKQIGGSYFFNFDNSTDMAILDDPEFILKWNKNRIIGRSITLRVGKDRENPSEEDIKAIRRNEEEGFQQMWDQFYAFLNLFGEEIWSLNLVYSYPQGQANKWEENMLSFLTVELFGIFPNLRKLRINGGYLPGPIAPEDLSPAPHLETLECDDWEDDEAFITALLQKHHTQLRSIHLNFVTLFHPIRLEWPNLLELRLNKFVGNLNDNMLVLPEMPQLTKLEMDVSLLRPSRVTFQSLMDTLWQYTTHTSLNTLRLDGGLQGFRVDFDEFEGSCYTLANIKTLEFGHMMDWVTEPSYDFLLHLFPLLENLNIFVRKDPRGDSNEGHILENQVDLLPRTDCERLRKPPQLGKELEILEVNKYMYGGEMYKSNIWELLPKLKTFSFQYDVFTRDGYEVYQKRLSN